MLAWTMALCAGMLVGGGEAEPPAVRAWPVHIVDGGSHPAGQPPMVVVGSLFTGSHCYREDDSGRVHLTPADEIVMPARLVPNKYSAVMDEYLLGNVKPRRGCNEEETCVFLRSPPLNAYDEFTVDDVEQRGNTFTVRVSHWTTDQKVEWGPGSHHEGQMLRLGWLEAGEYVVKVECRDMRAEMGGSRPGLYEEMGVGRGEVGFTIVKSDAWQLHNWDEGVTPAQIRELKKEEGAQREGKLRQLLYYAHRDAAVPMEGATLAFAPALDWRKYGQKAEGLWGSVEGAATADATLVARFTTPKESPLGVYDWNEVTGIEWDGDEVTVHAAAWRKAYIYGNEKAKRYTEFAVPLETRGMSGTPEEWLARVKVRVVWKEGIDNPRNAVEEVRR